jgi:VWFA-related protein
VRTADRDSNRPAKTAALAFIVAANASAQTQPGARPGGFSEIIDVRVVNLEVVVTDREGLPIRGLKADHFVLLVDGEEVPIEYFSEVLGGRTVRPVEGVEAEAVPGLREVVPGGRVGTSYLVFIDNFFSLPTDRNRVLRAFEESLFLGPEDRMAIVSFDGRNLEMLSTWSQSDVDLRRVINKSLADPAHGLQRLSERRQFDYEQLLEDSSRAFANRGGIDAMMHDYLDPNERYHVTRLSEQVERSVAAASATLRSFAMPPGRKVMLLLSGGWPLLPADFLLNDIERYVIDRSILAGEPLFRPLVDTANLLGYTIYPVDVPGLTNNLSGAEIAAPARFESIGTTSLAASGFLRETDMHATLRYLARETGGRALINAERIRAFETVVEDTRSYYWLGFTPSRDWDDRRHAVEVKTSNPSLRLRARQGFLDSSRGREVSMAVESALLFGGPTGEDLLKVEFGEPEPAGRGKIAVPIRILIPLDQLTFLPAAEGLAADVELRLGLVDDNGGRSEIPTIPITIRSPAAPAAGAYTRYETALKMRRRPHRAVIAIYDKASGRILSAGANLEY